MAWPPTTHQDVQDAVAGLQGNLYGFTPAVLPTWRKALARVRSGAADGKLLCIGDSTVQGSGDSSSATPAITAWPADLQALLSSYLVPAVHGLAIPPGNGAPDARWTIGSGWAQGTGFGFAGTCLKGTNPAGSLVFSDSRVVWDRADIYYLVGSTGTISATATGGSATTQATPGGAAVSKFTVSAGAASSANTLTITQTVGDVYIVGVDLWSSANRRIRVGNAGVSGSTSGGWAQAGGYTGVPSIQAYAPDLTFIMVGTNDATNGVTATDYLTNIQALISAARASGDVIVVTPVAMNPAVQSTGASVEAGYIAPLLGLAPSTPVADLNTRMGSWSAYNTLGFMYDDRHPNDAGYQDIAALMLKGLLRAA